jgi:hypothetical protein
LRFEGRRTIVRDPKNILEEITDFATQKIEAGTQSSHFVTSQLTIDTMDWIGELQTLEI